MSKLHIAVLGLVLAGPAHSASAPSIEDFVRHPTYGGVKISPTGEYLAVTVDRGEQDVLTILRTKDLSLVKVNQLPDQKSVGGFYWTSPERLLFNAVRKRGKYERPFGTGEWFAVNADGSQPRPLIFYGTRDATQRGKTVFVAANHTRGQSRVRRFKNGVAANSSTPAARPIHIMVWKKSA